MLDNNFTKKYIQKTIKTLRICKGQTTIYYIKFKSKQSILNNVVLPSKI